MKPALGRVLSLGSTFAVAASLAACPGNPIGVNVGKKDAGNNGDGGGISNCTVDYEKGNLTTLAGNFSTFHDDTHGWPFANRVWLWDDPSGQSMQINGLPFNSGDTAMFMIPQQIAQCTAGAGGGSACWNGPYLKQGTSLGQTPWLDCWGNARMYYYLMPQGGPAGGGYSGAPYGEIVVWSKGPDGVDGYACTGGTCVFNPPLAFAPNMPQCSEMGCDDIIVEVSQTACAASNPMCSMTVNHPDAGQDADAGMEPADAGTAPDAGGADAGHADGGVPDAGIPDAGIPDAG